MRAGHLRHRIIQQTPTDAINTHGEVARTWAQAAEIWASVRPLRATERIKAGQQDVETDHIVKARYRAVAATDRFLVPMQRTTLNGAIATTNGTSITVTSAAGYPADKDFRIRIDSEIMNVTAGQGTTTWTVTRAMDGTSGATHADAATVEHMAALNIGQIINPLERDAELEIMCSVVN